MSNDATVAKADKQPDTIASVFNRRRAVLQALVGEKDIARFMAATLSQVSKVKGLEKCTPESFFAAAHTAATLNLMPGPFGHVYLIPYSKTATLIVGYKGMMELAMRHTRVKKITAELVYKGEAFRWNKITGEILQHDSSLGTDTNPENIVGAYCRVILHDSDEPISLVYNLAQIKERAKGGNFWRDHFAAMARKTVVRALFNGGSVPASSELQTAIELDIEQDKRADVVEIHGEPIAQVTSGWGGDDRRETDPDVELQNRKDEHLGDLASELDAEDVKPALLQAILDLKLVPSVVFAAATELTGNEFCKLEHIDLLPALQLQELLERLS